MNNKNAFYNRLDHSVNVCSAFYSSPNVELAMVIGHELGHAIDPCVSSENLYKAKDEFYVGSYVHKYVGATGRVYVKGIDRTDHPLSKVDKCLVKNMGIRDIEDEDIEIAASAEARYDQIAFKLGAIKTKIRKEYLIQQLKEEALCRGTSIMGSQINETMSDVYGSIVLDAYLKKHPLKTENDRLAAINFWCEAQSDEDTYLVDNDMVKKIFHFLPRHPSGIERASKFIIQTPSVAKAFNCKRNPKYMCYESYLNPNVKESVFSDIIQFIKGGVR